MVGNYVQLVDKTTDQILAYNDSMEYIPRIGDMITLYIPSNGVKKYRVNDVEWNVDSEKIFNGVRFKVQCVYIYVTKIDD